MNDYLQEFDKFKNIKEMGELIEEIRELRRLYTSEQFVQMQLYIAYLMQKYALETVAWNSSHPIQPQSYEEQYTSAETFLEAKGAKIILETMHKSQLDHYASQHNSNNYCYTYNINPHSSQFNHNHSSDKGKK